MGRGGWERFESDAADITVVSEHAETPWRALTLPEARADLAETGRAFERGEDAFATAMLRELAPVLRDLTARAAKLPRTAQAARSLDVPPGKRKPLERALADVLQATYTAAQRQAAQEVARLPRLHRMAEPTILEMAQRGGLIGERARAFFKNKATWVTGITLDDVLKRAQAVLFNALKQDKTPGQVKYELDQAVADYLPETDSAGRTVNVPHRIETIARTNVAEAINEGRWALFTDPELEGFVTLVRYSAVLDSRTRETHRAWDGVTLPPDHPAWFGPRDSRPPNGFNCRCLLVPISASDADAMATPDSEIPREPAADRGFKQGQAFG